MDGAKFANMAEKVTKKYAKQCTAEIRNSNARLRRRQELTKTKSVSKKQAVYEIAEKAYMKASAKNTLPAVARQVYYAGRSYVQERTGKSIDGPYFTRVLIEYMQDYPEKTANWDIVFDARGNFQMPHTTTRVPLGTIAVREYISDVRMGPPAEESVPQLKQTYPTIGPENRCSAVMFIEKEGFLPLFEKVKLAERYDIAIMSTKGMSVIAARRLVDHLCKDIPLLVVRDFDKAGFSIAETIQADSDRYQFKNSIKVVDLGLRLEDAENWNLEAEFVYYNESSRAVEINLRKNGATEDEIEFLADQRIELNAFASDQLIEWLEEKLEEKGIEKVIPDEETLGAAYRRAYRVKELQNVIDKQAKKIAKEADELEVPDDIEDQILTMFEDDPEQPWDEAILEVSLES